MCLPNFIEFKQIKKKDALIGYRSWYLNIKNPEFLQSTNQEYFWENPIGRHKVGEKNSGLYSYNNYYYYYSNNYYYSNKYYYSSYNYNYNYNSYNHNSSSYNYNYNYNYFIYGIIRQYGKVAIHETGYRSERAYIETLFTIRESDAQGSKKFVEWIKSFNKLIQEKAAYYEANTIHWQDFLESQKGETNHV